MKSPAPVWIELEIERAPQLDVIRVGARGSRGERVDPQLVESVPCGRLRGFTNAVRRAAAKGEALPRHSLDEARDLHAALFSGAVGGLYARLLEASRGQQGGLVVRLSCREAELQRVPWESLCRPESALDFLGAVPELAFARGVRSQHPFERREVLGPVRLLAVAAIGDEGRLAALRDALAEPIAAGAVEWLPPIAGDAARDRYIFEHLRRCEPPHILHWFGHGGVDALGAPRLFLADGEGASILAETLAQELRTSVGEVLRLVFLEACSGARPGAFASAAEILAASGAEAVIAHLWPVRTDIARDLAVDFYRDLSGSRDSAGDVGRSLQATRRTFAERGAEVFSPVLYLRGEGGALFDFRRRRLVPPRPKAAAADDGDLAPLWELLGGSFSLILGDGAPGLLGYEALRADLERALGEHDGAGPRELPTIAEHFLLRSGRGKLQRLFQKVVGTKLRQEAPAYLEALARRLEPGAHTTLLWLPLLEWAIAQLHPERTIYVIQPGAPGSGESRLVLVREAGTDEWEELDEPPLYVDLDRDFVILRLYGGYSPDSAPVLTTPVVTEDDHIQELLSLGELFPADWEAHFMGWLRAHRLLCVGLSIFEWRHRMLLRWILDQRPPSRVSVAVVAPERDEGGIWEQGAGGLFDRRSIRTCALDLDDLGELLRRDEGST